MKQYWDGLKSSLLFGFFHKDNTDLSTVLVSSSQKKQLSIGQLYMKICIRHVHTTLLDGLLFSFLQLIDEKLMLFQHKENYRSIQ